MSNYVLVHGGSSNKYVWNKIVPLLKEKSHTVYSLNLSNERTSTLTNHILEVYELIEKNDINKVILVGHSYGGLVITGVANKIPEDIYQLVYIDTLFPISGFSLFDYFKHYNISTQRQGLDAFDPYTEPLYFDEETLKKIPKTHIRCTKSEFIDISSKACKDLDSRAKKDNWKTFELDTIHNCMITQPEEVAKILLGEI